MHTEILEAHAKFEENPLKIKTSLTPLFDERDPSLVAIHACVVNMKYMYMKY